ncbi:hypothetical protein MANAM107_05970 [Actinomyces capricornis]|uniref:Uncharacterized protein n=1 Tax=Actinomyces capricornis TaxID=2755559 RepID=A0ABN6K314_9ACTO|nr:hypothetical protein MANAM107_05970 [Actinomyces capricornis]
MTSSGRPVGEEGDDDVASTGPPTQPETLKATTAPTDRHQELTERTIPTISKITLPPPPWSPTDIERDK